MKKLIFCVNVVVISLLLFSCKSTKEVAEGEVIYEGNANINITKPENNKKSNKVSEKAGEEDIQKIEKRGMIGWIDPVNKNPSFEDGIVSIKTDSKLGTFCIYAVDGNGKKYPVISPLNEYSSTNFYLKIGKKKIKLIADSKIKIAAKALDNGISISYLVDDKADVTLKMEVFPSVVDKPADTIKVTVNVKNIGKKTDNFAVKAILDTVLGERGSNHFYTYEDVPIRSEYYCRSMKDKGWFTTKNDRASMQILLDGGDVTSPEFVALASYNTLEKSGWEPNMHTLGAFDTVLSYNNSAVGVLWPENKLSPEQSYKTTFYISLALDGLKPNGYRYVYGLPAPEEKKEDKNEEPFIFPNKAKVEKVETEKPVVAPVEEIVVKPNVIDGGSPKNVEFNIENISKEHLTQEYVQSLIDRIAELEQSGASVNRDEILQLNAEIDAILSILKN